MKRKVILIMQIVFAGLAMLATAWAILAVVHVRPGDAMLFVDGLIPKRSFEAFLHETSPTVQEDVVIAHGRGLQLVTIPLLSAMTLWFLAFVAAVCLQHCKRKGSANQSLEDIAANRAESSG